MRPFDLFAMGFAAVAVLNLAMIPKRGFRAATLAIVSALCAAASYLWDRTENSSPKWILAVAMGVLLGSLLYQSTKRKSERK